MNINIKKLHPDARVPEYATDGSACFDLHCTTGGTIAPGEAKTFGTGLAFEIDPAKVMKLYSRSGHGFKFGLRLSNGTGIIDSDYRQEVFVRLHNDSPYPYEVRAGDRIAQAMLDRVERVLFTLVDELSETARTGGLGSTGTGAL